MEGTNEATVAVIVFYTFWSQTVRRTQKQETPFTNHGIKKAAKKTAFHLYKPDYSFYSIVPSLYSLLLFIISCPVTLCHTLRSLWFSGS